MSVGRRVTDHFIRMRHQFGVPLRLGHRSYRLRGYFSNVLELGAAIEPELEPVLQRLLERPGTFVDVGANLGQTLGKVLRHDPARHYIGFEPQIAAGALIAQFLRDNDLWHMHILAMGLSDRDGLSEIFAHNGQDSMATMAPEHEVDCGAPVLVPVRRGDGVLAEAGVTELAALKIDVEGLELPVLNGLSDTICRLRPSILFEVLPAFVGEARVPLPRGPAAVRRESAAGIMHFFNARDYRVFQILADGSEDPIDAFNLDEPSRYRGANFVAHPR